MNKNHKKKVKIARKLLSTKEREAGVSLFDSYGWGKRKFSIKERVKKQQKLASERWARNFDRCIECHSTNFPHHGGGLCSKCRMKIKKPWIESRSKNTYETIHISCPICSKVHNTDISTNETEKKLEIIQKLIKNLEELHETEGNCQKVPIGKELQPVVG